MGQVQCCTGANVCEGTNTAFMLGDMDANQPPRKHNITHNGRTKSLSSQADISIGVRQNSPTAQQHMQRDMPTSLMIINDNKSADKSRPKSLNLINLSGGENVE